MKKKGFVLFLFLLFLIIPVQVFGEENPNVQDANVPESNGKTYEAEVLKVKEDTLKDSELLGQGFEDRLQVVTLKILEGPFKGQQYTIRHYNMLNSAYNLWVEKGDKVQIYAELTEDGSKMTDLYIADFVRYPQLRNLVLLFAVLVIMIGKWQGVKSFIGLGLTTASIVFFMLPMLLKGYSPILLASIVCAFSTVVSILLISGFSKKSFTTILGTLSGVLIAGILAYLFGNGTNLTGMSDHESQMLMFIPQGVKFNFKGLLFSGFIIGALGAIMDVAMTISSAMEELITNNPNISPKDLMKSGLVVGKDSIGTMSNTLILAYVGSSLPLLLLFSSYQSNFIDVVNMDLVATEIVRAFTGSIGLLAAVPMTVLSYGLLYSKINKQKKENSANIEE
ncbi:YibE/F family protein [Garciella nitratireducens]|uniref:Uncharacterized membrane protein n=1 Tax=Garciella nitratireducens DSM 15102 TaxID=1121911 RepID=A0A1T4NQA7_9FIRM|nr:YibE/F family protein [Garciella nitratireducens]RBP44794.1 putative membrane protein [Garciella nitratireducens]SJZ80978.1 Uncharacterized membrane protein [Garciella nitratireducens DSM 15102]